MVAAASRRSSGVVAAASRHCGGNIQNIFTVVEGVQYGPAAQWKALAKDLDPGVGDLAAGSRQGAAKREIMSAQTRSWC